MHVEHEGNFESHLDLRRRQPAHVLFLCFDLGLESGVDNSPDIVAMSLLLLFVSSLGDCISHMGV